MSQVKKNSSKSIEQATGMGIVYSFDSTESVEEAQRHLDKAFDVLFDSIYQNFWSK